MPVVRASFLLPSFLRLDIGEYSSGGGQPAVEVLAPLLIEGTVPRTRVCARFVHEDSSDWNAIDLQKRRDADVLLLGVNRLLRWYRTITHRAEMVELPRVQANPVDFEIVTGPADPDWANSLRYDDLEFTPRDLTNAEITQRLRDGYGSGQEPDVAELFLLDADRALAQGRFREAVLFCWSTIDSVFTRKYDSLVATALAGEWAAARDFFTGIEVGMRNKMTGVLFLVSKCSLYRQPGDLWQRLSNSYTKRNLIIHRGENATEDEARQAIAVANEVVRIMHSLTAPVPEPEPTPAPAPDPESVKKPRRKGK